MVISLSDCEETRYKEIGLRIGYYRRKKGLTQAQLAELVDISPNYMGSIERGNKGKSYSMDVLFSISDALDVSVSVLLGTEGI